MMWVDDDVEAPSIHANPSDTAVPVTLDVRRAGDRPWLRFAEMRGWALHARGHV